MTMKHMTANQTLISQHLGVSTDDAAVIAVGIPSLRADASNIGDKVVGIADDDLDADKFLRSEYSECDGLRMERASKLPLPSGRVAVVFL